MKRDRLIMAVVMIATVLCTIKAIFIKDWGIAVLLVLSFFISFYILLFKLRNKR